MDHLNQQQKDPTKKINIGIILSFEKKLLESSIGLKDDLKKIVYKSGWVEMYDKYLKKNNVLQLDDKETIKLGRICNCVVSLSVRDIINISFKPFLRDMASVVSTLLVNKELFGPYNNIEYVINVMYLTENRQLQPIFASLPEEEMFFYKSP
ncbi:hypothetical protein BD770DRAFT_415192 [Pilaira anomala]|nr:hypothetical protein BD770DRAFT_415192 [Pilaira anomala]